MSYRCVLCLICTSALFANEGQNIADNMIRRAHPSIAHIEEGKIFLKPESLCLRQGIIYVEDIEGAELAIPVVFPFDGHPYVQVGDSIIFNSWKCECGAWNHKWDNPTHCRSCGRPR
jgi:hypothetical protein